MLRINLPGLVWFSPRIITTLIIGLFTACKPGNGKNDVATLDNFAASNEIKRNSCRGPDEEKKTASVQTLLATLDGPRDKILLEEVENSLSAVPKPLRDLYVELGGTIRLTPDSDGFCAPILKEAGFSAAPGPNGGFGIEGCYYYFEKTANQPRILEIIIRSDVASIRHALVREFGYFYSQKLLRSDFDFSAGLQISHLRNARKGIADRKTALANAFFADLEASPYFSIEGLEPLTGSGTATLIRDSVRSNSPDVLKNAGVTENNAERVKDFIFAEAFDSFYCNLDTVDESVFSSVVVGDHVSPEALKPVLEKVANTRVIMGFLFNATLNVFNILHSELWGDYESGSLALTGDQSCSPFTSTSAPKNLSVSPASTSIFGNSPQSKSVPSVVNNSSFSSTPNVLAMNGANGPNRLSRENATDILRGGTLSTGAKALAQNLSSSGLQSKPFNTRAGSNLVTYPVVATTAPKPVQSALNAAAAHKPEMIAAARPRPAAAKSAAGSSPSTSSFALSGGAGKELCKKVIGVAGESTDDAARLTRKAASALPNAGGVAGAVRSPSPLLLRRAAGGAADGGGVAPLSKSWPSKDGFTKDLTSSSSARRAELHRASIKANNENAVIDGVPIGPDFAKNNAIHTNRVAGSIVRNGDELSKLGLDINRMRTAAEWHDIGKTNLVSREELGTAMMESAAANGQKVTRKQIDAYLDKVDAQPPGQQAFTQRILLHEFHTLPTMQKELKTLGYSEKQIDLLKRDILWHNDGGKQAGTFWHEAFKNNVTDFDYGLPQTKEGAILTFFDRVDQGSVDPKALTGGPFKIAPTIEAKYNGNMAQVVNEAFRDNYTNTRRQIDALVERNPFIKGTQTYERGVSTLDSTKRMYDQFEFGTGINEGKVRVKGALDWAPSTEALKQQLRVFGRQ